MIALRSLAIVVLVSYLVGALLSADLNVAHWPAPDRGFVLFVACLVGLVQLAVVEA